MVFENSLLIEISSCKEGENGSRYLNYYFVCNDAMIW